MIHIYDNPFEEKYINGTFFIPKEIVKYYNSLKIEYNNFIYNGVVANPTTKILKEFEKDDENKCINLLEFNAKRKKYFYINLKNIKPNQKIKIELNFIQEIEVENDKICYIIPNLFIPLNNSVKQYNYKYEINVKNTKPIINIFCNYEKIELNVKNEKEFNIKYSNIRKNDTLYIKNFKIEYDIKQNIDPDIMVLKHPLYENDYVCHFSVNPKYLIEEKEKENIFINKNDKYEGNILIYIIPNYRNKKLQILKQSAIYLIKSLPQKVFYFNIVYSTPIFNEYKSLNENNINEAINIIESFKEPWGYDDPEEEKNCKKTFNFIKKNNSRKTRMFIIGELYQYLDYFFEKIDKLTHLDLKIYSFVINNKICDNRELTEIKKISDLTNGNIILHDFEKLPDKIIDIFQNEMDYNNYITDIELKFVNNNDDNYLLYFKNLENKRIDSNIEFITSINDKNNKFSLKFSYNGKKYEYFYTISLDKFEIDDMLHKILYYNKYYDFSFIRQQAEIENKKKKKKSWLDSLIITPHYLNQERIDILNKYQILTIFNELFLESNPHLTLEQKINIERKDYIILKPRGNKLLLYFKFIRGDENLDIICYSSYLIKEIKIILGLLKNIFYNNFRIIYNGKASIQNDRLLEDYNIQDKSVVHVITRGYYNRLIKNNFDLYNVNKIFRLIKNQTNDGLWIAEQNNFQIINNFGNNYDEFIKKYKDVFAKFLKKNYSNDILFTIAVVAYLDSFYYRKRLELIINKAINYLKLNIEEYNEKFIKEFQILM